MQMLSMAWQHGREICCSALAIRGLQKKSIKEQTCVGAHIAIPVMRLGM